MSLLSVALAGCGREDVKVYQVAKTTPDVPPGRNPQGGNPHGTPTTPALTWKTPAGWEEVEPGEMRVASFKVKGDSGQMADVSVVPLPGLAGGDLNNVNRWRGQVGQSPVTQEELDKLAEPVEVAGKAAKLFDQAGQPPNADSKQRILGVVLHHDGVAWFFKLTGDDELVQAQKPAFVAFLKSLQFAQGGGMALSHPPLGGSPGMSAELPPDHPPIGGTTLPPDHPPIGGATDQSMLPPDHPPIRASATTTPAQPETTETAASSSEGKPKWTVPASWKEEPLTQMLMAKFSATDGDARAEITVSAFPGDVGGLLANVNRWRRQINLPPIGESALATEVTPIQTQAGPGSLVSLEATDSQTGKGSRLVGVAVPHAGETWFFKIMGEARVVVREKDAFVKFVQSTRFPDAP